MVHVFTLLPSEDFIPCAINLSCLTRFSGWFTTQCSGERPHSFISMYHTRYYRCVYIKIFGNTSLQHTFLYASMIFNLISTEQNFRRVIIKNV